MKVKAGQWYRTRRGVFNNVSPYASGGYYYMTNGDEIIKVADTPQELIQVGDIVCYDTTMTKGKFFVEKIEFEWVKGQKNCLSKQWITAIYTPNKDKTQYTEQWRKE